MQIDIRMLRSGDEDVISSAFTEMGWSKPREQYVRYLEEQARGVRECFVATVDGSFAGYVTLNWEPTYAGIAGTGIPDIQDLNVIERFRRRGIASRLLDRAERAAATRSSVVAIGVGLHPGYNAAQVLYVKRGYVPDGLGVSYGDRFVQEGESVPFDDSLVLSFRKVLA